LVGDPAAALERLAAVDPIEDPVLRFEADLLVARARSLSGNPSAAREAATRAWSSAALQPTYVLGPMRAALVMAGLAADASDRDRALAMLNVARAADVTVDRDASAFLPICGEEGVMPDDRVIFAAYRDLDWQRLVPVSASRPAVVAPFVRALKGRTIIARRTNTPAGTLVAVRCRSVPSAEWREVPLVDPTARVFAENGVYLPGNAEWDSERVSAAEQSIADIMARNGDDHPALVQPLAELIEKVGERVRLSGASPTVLVDLDRRMIAAMRNLDGAEQIMLVTASEQAAMLAASDDPERSQALWESMMIDRIGRADFARAFELTQLLTAGDSRADEATKMRIVSALLQRAGVGPTDIRRRALLMRLGEIQTEIGEFDGAVASYRAAGVSADNCLVVHNGIRSSGGEISADAYPEWAARYGAAGTTAIEYGVDAEGRVAHQRVVYSTPGGLFDAVATEAFRASYRYVPRRPGSRPRSCIGPVVSIHWRMADEDEEVPVRFDLFGLDPI
jgi:hypothetical protein